VLGLSTLRVVAMGLGCPVGVGWVGPDLGCRPCWSPGSYTGYLDPEKWICVALGTRRMGVLKIPGTVLVACRRKGSRVTWRLAVQFKMR